MALSLKEKMAKASEAKELKRAQRSAKSTDLSGRALVDRIKTLPFDLRFLEIGVVSLLRRDSKESPVEKDLLKDAETAPLMKLLMENGDIATQVRRFHGFVRSIPLSRRLKLNTLTWNEWVAYGEDYAMSEDDVVWMIRIVYMILAGNKGKKGGNISSSFRPGDIDNARRGMDVTDEESLFA